jgi:amidase
MQFFVSEALRISVLANKGTGPTTPYASVEHGDFKYVGYTGVFNVLDYAAVSFPTGFSASSDHQPYPPETSLTDICKEVQGLCA